MSSIQAGNSSAVREENVEESIVVEIKERDAAKRRVDERFIQSSAVVRDEVDLRSLLPVFESNLTCQIQGCRRRFASARRHGTDRG